MQVDEPVPSGAEPVDTLLGGGYERGTVTQVYGPPAAGKSNLVLMAAVATAAVAGRSLYIDTEGLSADRFEQLAEAIAPDTPRSTISERIVISEVHSFDDQREAIKAASDVASELDLIVVDSATAFYRLERIDEAEDEEGDALRRLANQVAHLLGLARRYELAVVITNQVFTDPEVDTIKPLGGYTLQHWCGTILKLERYRGGARRLTLEKHRSRSAGESVRLRITDRGLTSVEAE